MDNQKDLKFKSFFAWLDEQWKEKQLCLTDIEDSRPSHFKAIMDQIKEADEGYLADSMNRLDAAIDGAKNIYLRATELIRKTRAAA